MNTSYNDFQLTEEQVNSLKRTVQERKVAEYIKANGVEPDAETFQSFFAATAEQLEMRRRSIYALMYQPEGHDYSQDYLTLVMLDNGSSIRTEDDFIKFSKDEGQTWVSELTGLVAGDRVLMKGEIKDHVWDVYGGSYGGSYYGFCDWENTGRFNVEGNILSIYDSTGFTSITSLYEAEDLLAYVFSGTSVVSAENLVLPLTQLNEGCYAYMFAGCSSLTTAPSILPATTLAKGCYDSMFSDCTGLTAAPALPVTSLTDSCYAYMFQGCTELTTAPELPATTLAQNCYAYMFYGCTNLNYIKCLATNISASDCTYDWVYNVASTGTFVKAPGMTSWTTDTNGIPTGWTVENA